MRLGTQNECTYGQDGRRSASALSRQLQDEKQHSTRLRNILRTIQGSDSSSTSPIIEYIRRGTSVDEIESILSRELGTEQSSASRNEEFAPAGPEPPIPGPSRRSGLRVADLVEAPVIRVPAKPWTDVTNDAEFVSHLITIYFTWDHSWSTFFDKNIFLVQMRSLEANTMYCTPLLVNAILAFACVSSFGVQNWI